MKTAFDAKMSLAYYSYAPCVWPRVWQADRQMDRPPTDRRSTAVRHMQVINKSSALCQAPNRTQWAKVHCEKLGIKIKWNICFKSIGYLESF